MNNLTATDVAQALLPVAPRLRTAEVAPANLAVGETELGRNAVVWQPILAAGGLSSPPGGLKGRLQARLPATIACHTKHANFHGIRSSEDSSRRFEMRPPEGREECLRYIATS